MSAAQLRGADLERRIERFLALHGYACRRNAVVEGRSGARHEIDVLAETRDGVTGYRLAVECKAWNHAVDKEVVAKTAFVVGDLGLHKGIVVALAGATLGAEQAARELGIELWRPADLESRLGQVALAEVRNGPPRRAGTGLAVHCTAELARRLVRRERRGWCWRRERLEAFGLVWVPHHLLTVATTEPDGRFGQRGAVKATWRWNLYEALTGSFTESLAEDPPAGETDLAIVLPAAAPAGRLVASIRRAVQRRDDLVSAPARERLAATLESLGLPGDALSITVEEARILHYPLHVGVLTSGSSARVVAVDAYRSKLSPAMSALLTGSITPVRRALQPCNGGDGDRTGWETRTEPEA